MPLDLSHVADEPQEGQVGGLDRAPTRSWADQDERSDADWVTRAHPILRLVTGLGDSVDQPVHQRTSREAYDAGAQLFVDTVGSTISPEFEAPLDRALLDVFAAEVRARVRGEVIDAGCGSGRVTQYLAERGLAVRGVDISSGMIEQARRAHTGLSFEMGGLTDLPAADGAADAVVYWYSIISTPPDRLAEVWQELTRVIASDGDVLVAFQAGENDQVIRPNAYGSDATLTLYRHRLEDVADSLSDAGFRVQARVLREPQLAHETTPQGFLWARRSALD